MGWTVGTAATRLQPDCPSPTFLDGHHHRRKITKMVLKLTISFYCFISGVAVGLKKDLVIVGVVKDEVATDDAVTKMVDDRVWDFPPTVWHESRRM